MPPSLKLRVLWFLLALVCCSFSARAQLVIGGKEFQRAPAEAGVKGEWVVYPKGAGQDEANRRWLTRQVLVQLKPWTAQLSLRSVPGVTDLEMKGRYAVVKLSGAADAALDGAARLRGVRGVVSAEPMLARQFSKKSIPTDPYFSYHAGLPGYQWHLKNTGENGGTLGIDANVTGAWDSWTGSGVTIGIVDDGLEVTHPDLSPNVSLLLSHDFNDADSDPSPGAGDYHGTSCAGVAAARWNNGLGGSGAAPEATLAGMRLIAGPITDADEADAYEHEKASIFIKSNSWGPYDGAFVIGGPGPLGKAALEDAVATGRGGLGTIFLWAGGNGNANGDDSNYDGWANSIQAMAVSAITDKGKQSYYSEPGSNMLVCAPSNGGTQGVTTTDRVGSTGYNSGGGSDYSDANYTNSFGGTSSATPLAAGVAALMLQANPGLGWRDVQEILVKTAKKNDDLDSGWITNGAGQHFNVKYGAGMIDATAAVNLAATWTNLEPMESRSFSASSLALAIPDGDAAGAVHAYTVGEPDNLRVEHVTVHVNATHSYRGNLEWWITSPSGVSARLARSRIADTDSDIDWSFMTTHFWGERSVGEWKLKVVDATEGNAGVLNSATLTFYGTPVSGPLPFPVITSSTVIVGREGASVSYQMTASNSPTSFSASGLPTGVSINPATGFISGEPTSGGGYYFGTLSATNASGTTTADAIFFVYSADPSLSVATDQPLNSKIITFGDADWFSQSTTTHDSVDAAQSGDIADDETTGMEMTVSGPSTISFQWKVSSEPGYDYLVFVVDGVIRGYISGSQDWASFSYSVGAGDHNVDFVYFKDESVSTGGDAGWIDELVITPITAPPVVSGAIAKAFDGVPFNFQVTATNAPTSYAATGLPAGLTISATTGRITGTTILLGAFPVTISATNDFGTGTATFNLLVAALSEGLAAAVEASGRTFTVSGDAPWSPQTLYAHDGVDAARSGTIGDLSESVMSTVVMGPATGSFYWGISSEATYDFLHFAVDGIDQASISGEVGWTLKTFTLAAGPHTLRWTYKKDDFVKSGLDSGFVDELHIIQDLDNDGFPAETELYFGTSDTNASQGPVPVMTESPLGVTIQFPSVAGNSYRLESSTDLTTWTPVHITADGTSTEYLDPAALTAERKFYRVLMP